MKNTRFLFLLSILFFSLFAHSQAIKINSNTNTDNTINEAALLELDHTEKGFLLPSMTTSERNTISNPEIGLVIFNTETKCNEVYRNGGWFNLCDADKNQIAIAENTNGSLNLSDTDLQTILNGFEQRRADAFATFKGKSRIVVTGGSTFNRRHSYSHLDFAFKCFWNNEQNDLANQSIIDNCNLYLDANGNDISNDDYYWTLDMLFAMIEYFGSNGSIAAGRLNSPAENRIMEYLFYFTKHESIIKSPALNIYDTWNIKNSENHEMQLFYAIWHASKFLKNNPIYSTQTYDDGRTPEQAYTIWTQYIKRWMRERARKGLFVEVSSEFYNAITIKGLYNIYDFGSDMEMKSLAGKLLNVFWADWAQEQINGVHGGAKARTYPGAMSIKGFSDDALFDNTYFQKMMWFYAGYPSYLGITRHGLTMLTSSYRVPPLILDMMLDSNGKGNYEKYDVKLGQALNGFYNNSPEFVIDNTKKFIKYSYNTPDFILGSFYNPALSQSKWTMISSQNRWSGVILKGGIDSRVFFQCTAETTSTSSDRNYNQFWSVQKKGGIIIQKLNGGGTEATRHSKYALEMKIWVADSGKLSQVSTNDWLFIEYNSAYIALKVVYGGYNWVTDTNANFQGQWMILNQEYSPVIMEIVRKSDYSNFTDFQNDILDNQYNYQNNTLNYETSYGDQLTFFSNYSSLPQINSQEVNLDPVKNFNSPYMQSNWNSGIITIRKGTRELVLDFN